MKLINLAILLYFLLLQSAKANYLRNVTTDDNNDNPSSSNPKRALLEDDPDDMVARCRGSRCDIPHIGYVRVLHAGEWLTPNQYLAEFDATGNPVYTFGLTADGTFGLYDEDGLMIWGPKDDDGEAVRCDKLKFQSSNGHLTCYHSYNKEDGSYRIDHQWKSKCKDDGYPFPTRTGKIVRKITLADGDVNQFDANGAVVWSLRGSQVYTDPDAEIEPICRPQLVTK
jgi:hypothetical protein